jgi:hypothetical protein
MKGILLSSPVSPMSYDILSSVSLNVLKFYQQLTGEARRIPFNFDDFHFCCSRVIGLDMTENRIFTLCCMINDIGFVYRRTDRRKDGQTDGHGETSIPPYNLVVGGIKTSEIVDKRH